MDSDFVASSAYTAAVNQANSDLAKKCHLDTGKRRNVTRFVVRGHHGGYSTPLSFLNEDIGEVYDITNPWVGRRGYLDVLESF